MPSDCCYFVDKAAAACAAPALKYFGSILHCSAVFTQNLGQTLAELKLQSPRTKYLIVNQVEKQIMALSPADAQATQARFASGEQRQSLLRQLKLSCASLSTQTTESDAAILHSIQMWKSRKIEMKEENKVKYYLFALGNSVVKVENGARWYRRDRQNHKWEASNSWLARFYDPAYDVVEIEYDEKTETVLSQWSCF